MSHRSIRMSPWDLIAANQCLGKAGAARALLRGSAKSSLGLLEEAAHHLGMISSGKLWSAPASSSTLGHRHPSIQGSPGAVLQSWRSTEPLQTGMGTGKGVREKGKGIRDGEQGKGERKGKEKGGRDKG